MKAFLNKATSTAAEIILFCVGCVIAGLGLSVVVLLALFALGAASLAFLAAPFASLAGAREVEDAQAAA